MPQFLNTDKSTKKIKEFVSFKCKFLDAAVESIEDTLLRNILTSIVFSGGRAYHTAIEGKCLWTLNQIFVVQRAGD